MIISIPNVGNKLIEEKRVSYNDLRNVLYIPLVGDFTHYAIVKFKEQDKYRYGIEFSTSYSSTRFKKLEIDNYGRAIIRPTVDCKRFLTNAVSKQGGHAVAGTIINNENYRLVGVRIEN